MAARDSEKQQPAPLMHSLTIEMEATAPHRDMSLREIAALRPGSVLRLAGGPRNSVELYSGGRRLASAELAQSGGKFAVRIVNNSTTRGKR
ncbi:FliM/FliN family flagellar motor C-terminal domain-containing protein [uncultured Paludibaculum sp.]|uniref:FliM/FliN family flagellar motor C-terminal domain-containing protein n=1 Tax=uncultured Paludibaculum sp. TaxID=1765020 RepID=UPI002AAACA24|nr:FliM/FliN family flagellar motor C-terminal domain-containing protein [uncultured Paludibaculum sp.]